MVNKLHNTQKYGLHLHMTVVRLKSTSLEAVLRGIRVIWQRRSSTSNIFATWYFRKHPKLLVISESKVVFKFLNFHIPVMITVSYLPGPISGNGLTVRSMAHERRGIH